MAYIEQNRQVHRQTQESLVNLVDEVLDSWDAPHPTSQNDRAPSNTEFQSVDNPLAELDRAFNFSTTLRDAREKVTAFIDSLNLQPGQVVRDRRTNSVVGRGRNDEYLINDGKGNQLAINRDGTVVYKDVITGHSVVEDVEQSHSLMSGANPDNHEIILDDRLTIGRDSRGIYAVGNDNSKIYLDASGSEEELAALGLVRDEFSGLWRNEDGWLEIDADSKQLTVPGQTDNPIVVDFNTRQISIGEGDDRIVFRADGGIDFYGTSISMFGETIAHSNTLEQSESRLEQQLNDKIAQVYAHVNAIMTGSSPHNIQSRIASLTALCADLVRLMDQLKPFPELSAAASMAHSAASTALMKAQGEHISNSPERIRSDHYQGEGWIKFQPLNYGAFSV